MTFFSYIMDSISIEFTFAEEHEVPRQRVDTASAAYRIKLGCSYVATSTRYSHIVDLWWWIKTRETYGTG